MGSLMVEFELLNHRFLAFYLVNNQIIAGGLLAIPSVLLPTLQQLFLSIQIFTEMLTQSAVVELNY